jgi:hypothetical protein
MLSLLLCLIYLLSMATEDGGNIEIDAGTRGKIYEDLLRSSSTKDKHADMILRTAVSGWHHNFFFL